VSWFAPDGPNSDYALVLPRFVGFLPYLLFGHIIENPEFPDPKLPDRFRVFEWQLRAGADDLLALGLSLRFEQSSQQEMPMEGSKLKSHPDPC